MGEYLKILNEETEQTIVNFVGNHFNESLFMDIEQDDIINACKSLFVNEFALKSCESAKAHVKFLKKNYLPTIELLQERLEDSTNVYFICDMLAGKILSDLHDEVHENSDLSSVIGVGPFQEAINSEHSLVKGFDPQLMIEFDEESAQYQFKKNSPIFTLELVKIISNEDPSLETKLEPMKFELDTVKFSGFGPVVWKENIFGSISEYTSVEIEDINEEFMAGVLEMSKNLDPDSKEYKELSCFILNICVDAIKATGNKALSFFDGKVTTQSEMKREDLVIIRAGVYLYNRKELPVIREFMQFIIRDDLLLNALNGQTGFMFNKVVARAAVDSVIATYTEGKEDSSATLDKTFMLSKHIWPRSSPIVFEVFIDRIPTDMLLSNKVFADVMNWGVSEENAMIYFEHIKASINPVDLFKRSEHDLNVRTRIKLRDILTRYENSQV